MTDWLVPLTPLLVLLIVLLFRFVGCSPFGAAPAPPPPAPLTITFDSPKANETIRGTAVPVTMTAAGGIAPYHFKVVVDGATTPVHDDGKTFNLNSSTLTNASHTLTATVKDSGGQSATASLTVIVSNIVPYRDFIMGNLLPPGTILPPGAVGPSGADLVCYWRLIESAAVGPGLGTAKDEKFTEPGDYTIPGPVAGETPVSPDTGDGGAEAVPVPAIDAGLQPGLIDSEPLTPSRRFRGGFVRVQRSSPDLYPSVFTLEAWVAPDWNPANTDFEHCLFDARERPLGAAHGFRVLTNRKNVLRAVADPGAVTIGVPEPVVTPLVPDPPNVMSSGKRHHVALTYNGTAMTLYLNGKQIGQGAVAYAPPVSTSLFIGIANALFDQEDPEPSIPALPIRPFIGRIQEVVLHKKALTPAEIQTHIDINHA